MPAAVALLLTVIVRVIGGHKRGPAFVMIAATVGFLVAYAVIETLPQFPPAVAKQKAFYLTILGLVLGLAVQLSDLKPAVERWLIAALPAAALLWLAQRQLGQPDLPLIATLGALWIASVVVYWRLSVAGEKGGALVPGVQLLVAAAAMSVVALLGASASLAQLAGALAAAMAGVLLWAFVAMVVANAKYGFGAIGVFGSGTALLSLAYVLVLFTEGVNRPAMAVLVLVFLTDLTPLRLRFGGAMVRRGLRPVGLAVVAAVPAAVAIGLAFLTGEGPSPY